MKRHLAISILMMGLSWLAVGQTTSSGLEGSWSGALDSGGSKLHIILTFTKSASGAYEGKFNSVDQNATVPIDVVTLNGDAVHFEIKAAGIVYDGSLNKDRTELNGNFSQGGQTASLNFKRDAAPAGDAKPQPTPAPTATPKPDYSAPAGAPYTAEDVSVMTPGGFALAGTLTLPKGASKAHPVPAIVTVTGSGPEDRDEDIGLPGYHPFRQIADSLGRNGIAVLRMDDRGTGASGGTFKGATSADFAEDARAGLAYLRTRPEINADRLGALGHSEGAVIMPIVAEKEPKLRAIVLLAGIAEPGRGTLAYQLKNGYEHDPKLTAEQRASMIAGIPARIDAMMAADPWMKFFLTFDPAATMRHVKTPVLILTGSNDQQAVPTQVPLMEAAFKEAGNNDVTAKVIPGVNHLFVTDADGFPGNYAKLPAPIMIRPDIVDMVTQWLVKRLR